MDREKIIAYMRRYGVAKPDDEVAFWGGVHKARCSINATTDDEKRVSRAWLKEHGMSEGVPL